MGPPASSLLLYLLWKTEPALNLRQLLYWEGVAPSFVMSDAFLIKMEITGAFCKVLLGEFAFLQALP